MLYTWVCHQRVFVFTSPHLFSLYLSCYRQFVLRDIRVRVLSFIETVIHIHLPASIETKRPFFTYFTHTFIHSYSNLEHINHALPQLPHSGNGSARIDSNRTIQRSIQNQRRSLLGPRTQPTPPSRTLQTSRSGHYQPRLHQPIPRPRTKRR